MASFNAEETLASVKKKQGATYKGNRWRVFVLPVIVFFIIILIWYCLVHFNIFPSYAMPSPGAVVKSFREDIMSGNLLNDMVASLWRVAVGFILSAVLGIPVGLWLGQHITARQAFLPLLNFARFLSPLAWIPFAILWFHIGDKPAVFLIFMATFFPLALAVMSAVATAHGARMTPALRRCRSHRSANARDGTDACRCARSGRRTDRQRGHHRRTPMRSPLPQQDGGDHRQRAEHPTIRNASRRSGRPRCRDRPLPSRPSLSAPPRRGSVVPARPTAPRPARRPQSGRHRIATALAARNTRRGNLIHRLSSRSLESCSPWREHFADQPSGRTCTTIRRPHSAQNRGGSRPSCAAVGTAPPAGSPV